MSKRRSPSPSPTVTLDVSPKQELVRSASEDSIRVIHQAVIFPSSPYAGRVSYIRRSYETDADIIRRQQAAIALQPLTFAEQLASKRKQLELKADKRKREKAAQQPTTPTPNPKQTKSIVVPEIKVAPPSGKDHPNNRASNKSINKTRPGELNHLQIAKGKSIIPSSEPAQKLTTATTTTVRQQNSKLKVKIPESEKPPKQ